ncbi:MAG: hypothetical protein ACREP5_07915 [Candidatus Binatia bacterium]
MPRKNRRSRSWVLTVLFYLLFPPGVWFLAFLLWFYWFDLERLFFKTSEKPRQASGQSETKQENLVEPKAPVGDRAEEKILDQERQKLEAIIKRLQERKAGDEGS